MTDKLLFIQMGGAIDNDYVSTINSRERTFSAGDPAFQRVLKRAHVHFPYRCDTVACRNTSPTSEDRALLTERVRCAPERRIIITHDMGTVLETARNLAGAIKDKVVVFTGSLLPERFTGSDADFNLGLAVGIIPWLPKSVYIAEHGQVNLVVPPDL